MRIFLIIIVLVAVSCQNKSTSNYFAFETLDNTLLESSKQTQRSTETIIKSLEDKLSDPGSKIKAALWYPKLLRVHALITEVYNYLEQMKAGIKKAAGLKQDADQN